jgi:excisionase family DNA binding protein
MTALEALWTAEDVAGYLRVSRKTVYHWAEAGTIPHRKLGALLRFVPAEVRAWAEGRTAHPSPIALAK